VPPELQGEARAEFIRQRRAMRRFQRGMGQHGAGPVGPVDELALQEEARRKAQISKMTNKWV
jgi:hypothetical protein